MVMADPENALRLLILLGFSRTKIRNLPVSFRMVGASTVTEKDLSLGRPGSSNMSQISAREDSKSHAARDHWIAERIFDWLGVPTIHLRLTFFSQWLLYPFARKTIVEQSVIDLPYGAGRHAPIAAEDQARLIAALLADPAAHVGKTYTLHGPTELDQPGIASALSEVLGRKIGYQPLTIPAYRDRLEKFGLPEFLIQHFCAIALDYQNGIFSGADKIIAEVTRAPPMTVQDFVTSHRAAFNTLDAAA